ncbi:hypothetical protein DESME_06350 [Desulfitobacterium metallireducens DSM 15288]|uniref:Uncharacterized protein n=1 Tax=Desulfitobacterium metallireducens DSM 15288 TaxID=871968 RepID=W0ECD7_9FIRM|nr:hypothetical protein DESME_06350 [Desulfitobacterium metallireducens DSM 15288]
MLLLLLFISGCASKPGLTQDDNYSIVVISPKGQVQNIPVQLKWNSNKVVVQNLLMETTFILSDLRTSENPPNESALANSTVLLKAQFPQSRVFNLNIDGRVQDFNLDSIEIEVEGPHQGRVILNETQTLQGIPDSNLKPTFDEFMNMLRTSTSEDF